MNVLCLHAQNSESANFDEEQQTGLLIYRVALSPVVELHLCRLPLLKLTGDVSRRTQDVFHIQEELLANRIE